MQDRFKKGTALLTTAATLVGMFLTAAPVVSAAVFSDVNTGTSYYQGIMWAYDHGIIQGYGNGTFGPDNCVRRAELVKMIVQYAHKDSSAVGSAGSDPGFSDVPSSAWFYPYVKEARYKNYVSGYGDGTFRPNVCVNRAEAMKIAYGALLSNVALDNSSSPLYYDDKLITDIGVGEWYAGYARTLFKNRLVGTDHTSWDPAYPTNSRAIRFFPSGSMSRKEVAQMIYLISNFQGGTSQSLSAPVLTSPSNGTNYPSSGNITLSWASASGATSYRVQIRNSNSGSYFYDQPATGNSYTYWQNVGSSQATYYWRVVAYNAAGSSAASTERYFTSGTGNNSSSNISLTAPATSSTTNYGEAVTFRWVDSGLPSSGGQHGVQLNCANGNYPSTDSWLEWGTSSNSEYTLNTSSSFTPSNTSGFNFSSDIYCRWRVVYYYTPGSASSTKVVSNEVRYIIFKMPTTALGTATLVYPANNASFTGVPQLTVSWSPASGATRYELMVLFGGNTSYKVYPVNMTSVNNLSYFIPMADFPSGKMNYLHRWKVRSYNVNNNWTDSAEWQFTQNNVQLSAPTLVSPANNATFSNFPRQTLFQWNSVSGAAKYQLELGCDVCSGGAQYSNPTYYETTNLYMYQNMGGAQWFRFRVRAYDASGNPGPWSNYNYFKYNV
ncbi:MAG: S-layer homology domain-containing protein [Candidatus Gracilibacteria bacterium]